MSRFQRQCFAVSDKIELEGADAEYDAVLTVWLRLAEYSGDHISKQRILQLVTDELEFQAPEPMLQDRTASPV